MTPGSSDDIPQALCCLLEADLPRTSLTDDVRKLKKTRKTSALTQTLGKGPNRTNRHLLGLSGSQSESVRTPPTRRNGAMEDIAVRHAASRPSTKPGRMYSTHALTMSRH